MPVVGGLVRDHVIRYLKSPPVTDLIVNIENSVAPSDLIVENPDGGLVYRGVVSPGASARFAIPSGFYIIHAQDTDGSHKVSTIARVQPGSSHVRLVMET